MDKRCGRCKWFDSKPGFGLVEPDGTKVGSCKAPIPLWQDYLYGDRSMDRQMSSGQDAAGCEMFVEVEDGAATRAAREAGE